MAVVYLLESGFSLACFYLLYWLLLRRETFFQWNRWYLLVTAVLSLVIPAIKIQLRAPVNQQVLPEWHTVVQQTQSAPLAVERGLQVPVPVFSAGVSWGEVFGWMYQLVALTLLLVLLLRLYRLVRYIRRCKKQKQGVVTLAHTGDDSIPVSTFFSYIFWNKQELDEQERLIFEHELVHVRQWHSLDVLFMETLLIWQWFNPLIYLYRRSLQNVHEYIADAYVIAHTQRPYEYAQVLAQQYRNQGTSRLLNTFHFELKNRLFMIAKHPSTAGRRGRYLLTLPVAMALMLLFSFRLIEHTSFGRALNKTAHEVEKIGQRDSRLPLFSLPLTTIRPNDPEPLPYIFYWGSLQTRLQKMPNGKIQGEISASPAEFREAFKREPRLWNGTSLEQHLSLQVASVAVRTDYNNENTYAECRKQLENIAANFQTNDQVHFSKIALPGNTYADITLYLSEPDPSWLPLNKYEVKYGTDPGREALRNYHRTVWGPERKVYDHQFFTTDAFWQAMALTPVNLNRDGNTSALTRFSARITRDGEVIFTHQDPKQFNGYTYPELVSVLNSLRDQIGPGVHIDLVAKLEGASDFYQQVGNFSIVADDDPRLPLKWSDQHDYYFEWGNLSTRAGLFYGKSFQIPSAPNGTTTYADHLLSVNDNSMTTRDLLQMLELPFRFMDENKALIKGVQFVLKYEDQQWDIRDQETNPQMLQYLKTHLKAYDQIILEGFKGAGFDLSKFQVRLDVKADNPKPPLRPAGKTADAPARMSLFPPSPNPTSDNVDLRIYVAEPCRATITLFDAQGKQVYDTLRDLPEGVTPVELPLSKLARGWYSIVVDTPLGREEKKILTE